MKGGKDPEYSFIYKIVKYKYKIQKIISAISIRYIFFLKLILSFTARKSFFTCFLFVDR